MYPTSVSFFRGVVLCILLLNQHWMFQFGVYWARSEWYFIPATCYMSQNLRSWPGSNLDRHSLCNRFDNFYHVIFFQVWLSMDNIMLTLRSWKDLGNLQWRCWCSTLATPRSGLQNCTDRCKYFCLVLCFYFLTRQYSRLQFWAVSAKRVWMQNIRTFERESILTFFDLN